MHDCSSCFRGNDVITETSIRHTVFKPNAVCLRKKSGTIFYCCGPPGELGSFSKRHGMSTSHGTGSVEIVCEAKEDDNFDVTKIIEPGVPYIDKVPVHLHVGRSIEILGKTLTNCNRFSINFATGEHNGADLALHLNPRLDRRTVVRNHRICNKWGVEEIVSIQPFPFKLGKSFSVMIFIADEQFMITINKIHFCAFAFRIPIASISHLIITGDIVLHMIHYSTRASYPPQIFSKTPYVIVPRTHDRLETKCDIRRKINKIAPGTRIEIWGRLKLLPRGFYVNLQQGLTIWPHPLVPFHMNLRIHQPGTSKRENEIIFNSWLRGCWEKEIIISLCPFSPGADFHIVINCDTTCYVVEVNDKFLYKHARAGSVSVDTVLIYGDVVVNKVILRRINVAGRRSS